MNKKNFDETDVTISIITHICNNPKMKEITEKELVKTLSEEFINSQKMTKSTIGKQRIIKRVTNKFIRKREEVSNVPNGWEKFRNRVIAERNILFSTEVFKILEIKTKKELTCPELDGIIDNMNQAKDVMRNLDKYVLNPKLAIALTKAGVFHITDLIPTHWIDSSDTVHLMDVEYADFGIEKNDINYLRDISAKIQNEKNSNHSTFGLEDEIDKYFQNKQYN